MKTELKECDILREMADQAEADADEFSKFVLIKLNEKKDTISAVSYNSTLIETLGMMELSMHQMKMQIRRPGDIPVGGRMH